MKNLSLGSRRQPVAARARLRSGIAVGVIGGGVGTVVMDLVLVASLTALGISPSLSFAIIGDTAAGFFAMFGIAVAGGVPFGLFAHYLLGLVLGGIFSAATSWIEALRLTSLKKGIVLAALYIEVVSQPILVLSPIILHMTVAETIQWFGISSIMHLIWGVVLGAFVAYRLRK